MDDLVLRIVVFALVGVLRWEVEYDFDGVAG